MAFFGFTDLYFHFEILQGEAAKYIYLIFSNVLKKYVVFEGKQWTLHNGKCTSSVWANF